MEEYAREPCPWRIVDDCGGAFTMGVIGGQSFKASKAFVMHQVDGGSVLQAVL